MAGPQARTPLSPILFYTILAVSAVLTSFISGILGMAGGMILMGILLAMMPVPAAMMLPRMTRHAVVATKAMTQSLSHIMKIAYFGGMVATGRGTVEPWLAAAMVVLAFIGTSLSRRVLERMDDAAFRRWTRWAVMATGTFYLGSGIALLLD